MKRKYIEKKFSAVSITDLQAINKIIAEYQAQGYTLTLRQLYYQLVARDLIPNTLKSYKRIGNLVSDGRLAGVIDWKAIEDRGRSTVTPPMWGGPAQIIEAAAQQFEIDRWADQEYHCEVMVEKAALEGILIPVCRELGIRFTANRGYSSQSAMYEIGERLRRKALMEQKSLVIFYLGDHDPSGIDMTRDVRERLLMFSEVPSSTLTVERLALNMPQVEQWQPPENPAKESDSRFEAYQEQFGDSSWELDAVEPITLAQLVRDAVAQYRDDDAYNQMVEIQQAMKDKLIELAQQAKKDFE